MRVCINLLDRREIDVEFRDRAAENVGEVVAGENLETGDPKLRG
jgi:hypothetical protein